jgi:hypothetical protein
MIADRVDVGVALYPPQPTPGDGLDHGVEEVAGAIGVPELGQGAGQI